MKWEDWASSLKPGDTAYSAAGPFTVAEVEEYAVTDTDGNEHSWEDLGPDPNHEPPDTDRLIEERDGLIRDVGQLVKERDHWAAEAALALADLATAHRDLRSAQSERELVLQRAIADLAVIWSRGVRP